MAILISGIGRSGTTTIYQIIGKGLLAKYNNARCVYEPYLWNVPEVEQTAEVKGQPFSIGQVGLFNKYVHCNTPLFLSGRHSLHDQWLRKVFGPIAPSSKTANDRVMAKVIRGAGRLEAALTKFTNLKIIIVTRNLIDTANSGLGLFSFFGDEFHPSDKRRFIEEVNNLYNQNLSFESIRSELDWSILWWHFLTEASLKIYEKYPTRVMLMPYEKYTEDKFGNMVNIFNFVGIEQELIDKSLFNTHAGPTTSISFLTNENLENLKNENFWYFSRLNKLGNFRFDATNFHKMQIEKFSKRKYIQSLLLTNPTDLTPVQWRNKSKILQIENSKDDDNCISSLVPLSVSRAIATCGSNELAMKKLARISCSASDNAKVGVLITSYNNQHTIAESIYSVLSQTRKPDLIYVADDCSTDNSVKIINEIAKKHSEIILIQRAQNIGVAANRDLAIRSMEVDYITTLDGDDLYYPEKIELELSAIQSRNKTVAFSNIAVFSENTFVQDTSPYSDKSKKELLELMISRAVPVPRDMMFEKSLFIKSEGFDVGMEIYEDWALKMRLVEAANENDWVHSGGIGTIYDRRFPGLSGKKPIDHAYGQLLALSRNALILKKYPEIIHSGFATVAKHLEGNMKIRFVKFLTEIQIAKNNGLIIDKLNRFWSNAIFKNDAKGKCKQIWTFTAP